MEARKDPGEWPHEELVGLAELMAPLVAKAIVARPGELATPPPRISNSSPEVAELMGALAKAQGAVAPIIKSKTATVKMRAEKGGGEYQYNFADLAMVLDALREPLSTNGLAIIQRPTNRDTLETILAHSSGQWIASYMPLIGAQGGPQAFGSAVTYARRYALVSLLGVSGADDDGAAAQEVTDRSRSQAAPSRSRSSSSRAPKGKPLPKGETKKQTAARKAAVVKWADRWVSAFGELGVDKAALELELGHPIEDCTKVEAADLKVRWAALRDSSAAAARAVAEAPVAEPEAPKGEAATGAVAPEDEPSDAELGGDREPGED